MEQSGAGVRADTGAVHTGIGDCEQSSGGARKRDRHAEAAVSIGGRYMRRCTAGRSARTAPLLTRRHCLNTSGRQEES
jgi:hypothetical protein